MGDVVGLAELDAPGAEDRVGGHQVEVELRQRPVAGVLLGGEVEVHALGEGVGDRGGRVDGGHGGGGLFDGGDGFGDAGAGFGEGAGVLGGVAAFFEQGGGCGGEGLLAEAGDAFVGLDAGEANLGGEGEHVGG